MRSRYIFVLMSFIFIRLYGMESFDPSTIYLFQWVEKYCKEQRITDHEWTTRYEWRLRFWAWMHKQGLEQPVLMHFIDYYQRDDFHGNSIESDL